MFCNSLTKNNQPCKVRVNENTPLYNGMRLCHVHKKKQNINSIVLVNNNMNNLEKYKNVVRCVSQTKKGCRCSKKTGDVSQLCHLHINKLSNIKEPKTNIENVSQTIFSMIKSPCINYKTNKKSDNCYICLEETETS